MSPKVRAPVKNPIVFHQPRLLEFRSLYIYPLRFGPACHNCHLRDKDGAEENYHRLLNMAQLYSMLIKDLAESGLCSFYNLAHHAGFSSRPQV